MYLDKNLRKTALVISEAHNDTNNGNVPHSIHKSRRVAVTAGAASEPVESVADRESRLQLLS